jgi:hypothetical protein
MATLHFLPTEAWDTNEEILADCTLHVNGTRDIFAADFTTNLPQGSLFQSLEDCAEI